MRSPFLASSLASLALLAIAPAASASMGFETAIPNGTCASCHTVQPATNSFGDAVKPIMATAKSTWWPTLRGAMNEIDSDNDGQTNAEELGDPCGTWKMGDPTVPRATDISNPGDATSTSMSPDVPPCGMGAGGASSAATSGSAATTGAGMAAGSGGSGAAGPKSTGAGLGDEPVTVKTGACASIAPTGSGGALAAAWVAIAVVLLKRRRRR